MTAWAALALEGKPMVMQATAGSCPQCGADVRASGARCASCGFWLPAAPAPRSGPPMARPVPRKDESRKTTILALSIGGCVILGLLGLGTMVTLRQEAPSQQPKHASAAPAPVASAPPRLEPSTLLAAARRRATSWHTDAVLLSLNVGPLDERGVTPEGTVDLSYGRPNGPSIVGGAETKPERLELTSHGSELEQSETRGGKAQIAPEPNCLFEDAWAAARRAGADAQAGLSLRYAWSAQHARPIWQLVSADGQVLRRLDGVTCSILTR